MVLAQVSPMVRRAAFGLGLVGLAAGSEFTPTDPKLQTNPLKVMNDEIASTKQFMEPLQGLIKQFGKAVSATAKVGKKAPVSSDGPTAELNLQKQAVGVVHREAQEKASGVVAKNEAKDVEEKVEKAVEEKEVAPEPAKEEPAKEEPAKEAPVVVQIKASEEVAAPATMAAPARERVAVSAEEYRKIWTVIAWQTPTEMTLLAKLAARDNLGQKFDEFCKDASSPAACKFETASKQYCGLLRTAASGVADLAAIKTVMTGMLEAEAEKRSKRASGEAEQAEQAASLVQASSSVSDDSATWDEVTKSAAFEAKVDDMCKRLENVHPGCRTVADDIAFCSALTEATMTFTDTDRLVAGMVQAYVTKPQF